MARHDAARDGPALGRERVQQGHGLARRHLDVAVRPGLALAALALLLLLVAAEEEVVLERALVGDDEADRLAGLDGDLRRA